MLRIGELCAGIGALGYAVTDVLDAQVVWHAQYEPKDKHQYAARILAQRFPGVPNHGDIKLIDYESVQPIDMLVAGFPCQSVSLAGRRLGMVEGTPSGLWREVARAINELKPELVFLENVRSLTSARADSGVEPCAWCVGDKRGGVPLRALGAVLGDLADLGFDAEWQVVQASDVGAPHRRERVFVLAWTPRCSPGSRSATAEVADREPGEQRGGAAPGQAESRGSWADARGRGRVPDPQDAPADGAHDGLERAGDARGRGDGLADGGGDAARWGAFAAAIAHWERVLGRSAPNPHNERGKLSPAFAEWMLGLDEGWVTGVAGVPATAQFAALGNAVVPAQAAFALRWLWDRCVGAGAE
jgi:DNA (cytosine-5)-methyltransferase 1